MDGPSPAEMNATNINRQSKRDKALTKGNQLLTTMEVTLNNHGKLRKQQFKTLNKAIVDSFYLTHELRQVLVQHLHASGWIVCGCRSEADTCIGSNCKQDDIVITCDIDTLVYSNINTIWRPFGRARYLVYHVSDLLRQLELSRTGLTTLGIVTQNDYGKGVHKIGVKGNFKVIRALETEDRPLVVKKESELQISFDTPLSTVLQVSYLNLTPQDGHTIIGSATRQPKTPTAPPIPAPVPKQDPIPRQAPAPTSAPPAPTEKETKVYPQKDQPAADKMTKFQLVKAMQREHPLRTLDIGTLKANTSRALKKEIPYDADLQQKLQHAITTCLSDISKLASRTKLRCQQAVGQYLENLSVDHLDEDDRTSYLTPYFSDQEIEEAKMGINPNSEEEPSDNKNNPEASIDNKNSPEAFSFRIWLPSTRLALLRKQRMQQKKKKGLLPESAPDHANLDKTPTENFIIMNRTIGRSWRLSPMSPRGRKFVILSEDELVRIFWTDVTLRKQLQSFAHPTLPSFTDLTRIPQLFTYPTFGTKASYSSKVYALRGSIKTDGYRIQLLAFKLNELNRVKYLQLGENKLPDPLISTLGGTDHYLTEIRNVVKTIEDVKRIWDCDPKEIKVLATDLGKGHAVEGTESIAHKETNLPSLRGPEASITKYVKQSRVARSLGYIVVGVKEYYTSKRCPVCHEFVGQVGIRQLYCPTCGAKMHRDVMAGHNMCNIIQGHLLHHKRPHYLQPYDKNGVYIWEMEENTQSVKLRKAQRLLTSVT
ncbi:hypothetical protein KI688_005795 [Linnemannia hyalina]|uniref:Cas12f1-like TNB domain-containing protein n=1 Tax=Linnemannia hyalina TaxID=64524 RepID=A0A9P7Y2K8_9FUNG|nr:hypothetical protein KI688_005795 [Linnemannia hyalina]